MTDQPSLFDNSDQIAESRAKLPNGFKYQPELIDSAEEVALLKHVRGLPFREFEFHGYTGKRRVVSYGWQYDFTARQLQKVDDIPDFLLSLRSLAASFAALEPEALPHVLVTEYGPGAAIGWHRDKAVFGEVTGISLHSSCVLRLRRAVGDKWEREKQVLEPRSIYLLSGAARREWEHSIPPVDVLRYSITFRNLHQD